MFKNGSERSNPCRRRLEERRYTDLEIDDNKRRVERRKSDQRDSSRDKRSIMSNVFWE
jgi:hypothetical protein